MKERELLKQLVDALDKELPHNMKHIAAGQRFNARVALAQPEQEPVIGTKTWFEDGKVVTQHLTAKDIYKDPEQPEQEQIQPDKVCIEDDGCPTEKAVLQRFWREHQKTQQQEPVACIGTNGELMWLNKPRVIYSKPQPLYTTPPQRTWEKPWVGLTEAEIEKLAHYHGIDSLYEPGVKDFYEAIADKLKEKNT